MSTMEAADVAAAEGFASGFGFGACGILGVCGGDLGLLGLLFGFGGILGVGGGDIGGSLGIGGRSIRRGHRP